MYKNISSSPAEQKAFPIPMLPSLSHKLEHQLSHEVSPKTQTALQQCLPIFEENYQTVSCQVDYIGKNTVTLTPNRMPIHSRQKQIS